MVLRVSTASVRENCVKRSGPWMSVVITPTVLADPETAHACNRMAVKCSSKREMKCLVAVSTMSRSSGGHGAAVEIEQRYGRRPSPVHAAVPEARVDDDRSQDKPGF